MKRRQVLCRGRRQECGSTLIEFAISAVILMMVILGVVEISRIVLISNALANAARAGARYAIVHGSFATPSLGPANDPAQVVAVIKNFAGAAPINNGLLSAASGTVKVRYLDNINTPGSRVEVTVIYPYDPFMTYFHFGTIRLGSVSRGVIVF
jgi:Flp pilus assembly protein TadG